MGHTPSTTETFRKFFSRIIFPSVQLRTPLVSEVVPERTSQSWSWNFTNSTEGNSEVLETNLASRQEGVRLPRASGKSPDFPASSPNFPGSFLATSPEVFSLWNLTAIQTSPEVSRTSPEVGPFLWQA